MRTLARLLRRLANHIDPNTETVVYSFTGKPCAITTGNHAKVVVTYGGKRL